jgi:hypothetical protein
MQPDVWANLGAEWPHFPFTGKPDICWFRRSQ